jgi:hypothetical protein
MLTKCIYNFPVQQKPQNVLFNFGANLFSETLFYILGEIIEKLNLLLHQSNDENLRKVVQHQNCLNIRHLVSASCTILAGCHFHYFFKLLMKVRKIIKSACVANTGNI